MATQPDSFEELIDAIAEGVVVDWPRLEAGGRFAPQQLKAAKAIAGMRDSSEQLASGQEGAVSEQPGFDRLEEIGHGAFGRVFRARDRVLGRDVALKVLENDQALTPEQRARFLREARALAACEHENIVRIHSVGERDGHLELCLELLDGVTIERLVREGGPLSAAEAARIGADLCRALAALHSRGLVHRDVKPANVMRVRGGRIVLLDFGLTHAADPTRRRGSTPGGTPLFMAPELLHGSTDFDARADLYSLGVTLYWLATAKWPYEAASREELVEKMEREPPIPLVDRRQDLPPEFVAIVMRALARDRDDRFASAGEMEAALRTIVAPLSQRLSRRMVVGVVAAAALIALVAAVASKAWRASPIEAEFVVTRGVVRPGATETEFVPMKSGESVKIGDQLMARLTLDGPAHVYVFNADRFDQVYAIFPMNDSTLKNPVAAGTTVLPGLSTKGDGAKRTWDISSYGVEESFFVFVSREPNQRLQAMWDACPKPHSGITPRGAGRSGVVHDSTSPDENVALKDRLMRLAKERDVPGVTVIEQTFVNAGH